VEANFLDPKSLFDKPGRISRKPQPVDANSYIE